MPFESPTHHYARKFFASAIKEVGLEIQASATSIPFISPRRIVVPDARSKSLAI